MIPAITVDDLSCGFVVPIVSQHEVRALGHNLTRDVLRVIGKYPDLHAVYGFSAAAAHKLLIVAVGDQRCALRRAVAHGDGESDGEEELLDLLREGSTTHDDLIEVTTEGIVYLLADALLHLLAYDGHRQQQAHAVVLYLGEYFLADNLLDDQRYGDDDGGLHGGKGLGDDGGRRKTCEKEKVTAITESEEELDSHSVHVGHRQDAQHIVACLHFLAQDTDDVLHVTPDGSVRQHHALRESSRTTGIVDERHLFGLVLVIVHVLSSESFGELAAE